MKPQLTLRDLFWMVLVVAMGCGWFVDTRFVLPNLLLVRERAAYWPRFNDHNHSLRTVGFYPPDPFPKLPWIRTFMGDRPIMSLVYDPTQDRDGSELREVRRLFPEATIWGWPSIQEELPEGIVPYDEDRHLTI